MTTSARKSPYQAKVETYSFFLCSGLISFTVSYGKIKMRTSERRLGQQLTSCYDERG